MNAPPFTAVDAALCAKIPGWFPAPNGLTQVKIVYGNIQVRNGQVVTPGWESDYMETWRADWMPKGHIYINKKVRPIFEDAFNACLALNDGYKVKTLSCFAPRAKRVNGDLSVHSWGAAIDLNSDTNPLCLDGVLRTDIPSAWIAEFEKRGLRWGGRFAKPDSMHVQYVVGY